MRNNCVKFTARRDLYTGPTENFGNWKQIPKYVTATGEMTLLDERETREAVSPVQPVQFAIEGRRYCGPWPKEPRERVVLKIWKII